MDDKSFDDIIKGKMEHYEPEAYDPAGLADLHYKMAAYPEPWYKRYRTELMVASAILLATLLNGFISWRTTQNNYNRLNEEIKASRNENKQLEEDQNRNLRAGAFSEGSKDTIYLTSDNSLLIRRINILSNKLDRLNYRLDEEQQRDKSLRSKGIIFLGTEEDIPEDLLYTLKTNGMLLSDGKNYYLVSSGYTRYLTSITPRSGLEYLSDPFITRASEGTHQEEISLKEGEKTVNMISVKTLRAIERHYMKGVGVKIAPTIGVIKPDYNVGSGHFKPSVGVLADLIISPSLSIETGLNYNVWNNEIDTEEGFNALDLPGIESQLGELTVAETDAFVLEFPVALKYRYPLSDNSLFTGSLGYSPVLFIQQDFEYDYLFTSNDPVLSLTVNTAVTNNTPRLYPGTINLSLGASRQMKKDNFLEISLQYKHGINKMGVEGAKPKIIGLRGAYWFKIR